jgi:regulator of sigma E protease
MIITGFLQACLGLFVLGLLVLIHELGHFLAAKLFKVRVLAFSIGFGRPLLSWRRGETEYRLSAIPVGGYVRMAGEQPEDNRTWNADEFPAKPVWQRAVIAVAGPGFNYVFAVAFLWLAFVLGVEQPLYLDSARIGFVADSSSAAQAGIIPGDRILSMNGHLVSDWQDVEKSFANLDKRYVMVVERNGSTLTFTVNGAVFKGSAIPKNPTAGLMPCPPPVIGTVTPGSPSDKAGMQKNDSVVAINGTPIVSWLQLSGLIQKYDSTRGPVTVSALRAGAAKEFTDRKSTRLNSSHEQ